MSSGKPRFSQSTELIARTAAFGLVIQWLEAEQIQEEGDDLSLVWLLIDRLAETAGPEVYVHRAQQVVQKMHLTLRLQKVENVTAAEEAVATLFVRTVKWKPEGAAAQQEKKAATAAYCSLCPFLLQFISAHASPELLAPLLSLAEKGPLFFREQHALLLQTVKQILAKAEKSGDTQRIALQLAASAFTRAAKSTRKQLDLLQELLLLLADAAASAPLDEEEEEASWELQKREEETPEETLQFVALELMTDVTLQLGGNAQTQAADAAPSSRPKKIVD
ncbi:hypothetical protein Efla_005227 [Eimeria flavescens]